jgi:predicted acetyltransferase
VVKVFEIKKIPIEDMGDLVRIVTNAYPAFPFNTQEEKEKLEKNLINLQEKNDVVNLYGYYEQDRLKGSMRLHDYKMNFFGSKINVGGVGLVAVDLLHKKEKIAKRMLEFYLEHYKKQGIHLVMLYPFRPDFYKKMGFGFGSKMDQFKIPPSEFPNRGSKKDVIFLTEEHKTILLECYQEFVNRNHGMLDKTEFELNAIFNKPENKIVGVFIDKQLVGYIIFTFKSVNKDNFVRNDIYIQEFIYLNREALSQLLTFINSQSDQINRVIIQTQDSYFHYLFDDARNDSYSLIPSVYHETNTSGVGIMYRVLDVEGIFAILHERNFEGITCKVKIEVIDSFFETNNGSYIVNFENGKALIMKEENKFDVEISLDVADFSALIMGNITFEKLHLYGLVEISDVNYVNLLHRAFQTNQKPICTSLF